MLGWWECCRSCNDGSSDEDFPVGNKPFSLPSPLPQWPKGQGFATGNICLGELEVIKITKFSEIWSYVPLLRKDKGVTFYKPIEIPDGYFCLGHYCQQSDTQLRGYLLVAKDISTPNGRDDQIQDSSSGSPALVKPLNYSLVWNAKSHNDGEGYIWLPNAPDGYKATGFVVAIESDEPDVDEVRCVRADLTDHCEAGDVIFDRSSLLSINNLHIWTTRPCKRGMFCKGVPVGAFFCCRNQSYEEDELEIACLKNLDSSLHAMPNIEQVHALIDHYGPTVYFHPDEIYLPSSVSWFFKNGALLYKKGRDKGLAIDSKGSNLPSGGWNDGEFWLDLPDDNEISDYIKCGNIESAELYVHVKPASGGTFTDIAMWIFCPFNGPSTIKAGVINYSFNRIGQHVGDWEHYTLRLSNFTGELWSVYFSEHSGGGWVDASELEFIGGNRPIVYSSKSGHACFPHSGCYIQGSTKLRIGVRNDCAESDYVIDSSTRYKIIAAEYLKDENFVEPHWLQYMREWGPTIVYDSRSELDKILKHFPFFIRFSLENLIEVLPTELYGEEGPTGPKEKDNWVGDERC